MLAFWSYIVKEFMVSWSWGKQLSFNVVHLSYKRENWVSEKLMDLHRLYSFLKNDLKLYCIFLSLFSYIGRSNTLHGVRNYWDWTLGPSLGKVPTKFWKSILWKSHFQSEANMRVEDTGYCWGTNKKKKEIVTALTRK